MKGSTGIKVAPTWRPPEGHRYVASGVWTDRLIDTYVAEQARRRPEGIAVVDRDRRVTYADLNAAVDRAAGLLDSLGVRRGDVVSFQLPNRLEAAVVHHATLRVGGVSNPIVPIYRGHEVEFILRQARTRVFIIPDVFRRFDHRAMIRESRDTLPDLAHVLVAGEATDGMRSFAEALATAPSAPQVERAAGDAALLLYTSGTEANPKGVLHTHQTLDFECRSIIEHYALTGDDVVFMASPVTHITGLLYGLQLPFMLGARVVLQEIWHVDEAVELIARERCGFSVGATPFLHGIVASSRDSASLRLFACGGADVPPALVREAHRAGIVASRVYGSTECPISTATPVDAPVERHATTDGRPVAPTQVRIVDTAGQTLPAGLRGELQVRGPDLCLGYLDPALNPRSFTADGWFRTGDLAICDREGYVTIAGRAKDVILRGGENLSAKEIEDLLFEHPDVDEVAVVGYPDEILGERTCAYVVSLADLRLEDLVTFLRGRRVANQKLPERLELVDALPKTASGKVKKYRLREALEAEVTS